jgi:dTDP-4-amino-4,6-dideoxygalactose transaminase
MKIPFNRPYYPFRGLIGIIRAVQGGTIAGNGPFTRKCHRFFESRYGFKKVLMTTSCTDALEMTSLLAEINPGDEVIMPSYTFVSSANAFVLRGAVIRFADTLPDIPNIDPDQIEKLITPKTKAILVVHYAGIACDMDRILDIARKNNLIVIEDAAHAIDSFYKGKPLGSLGQFGTFSFHETKNIFCGEGGLLTINDESYLKRAEIIWEKGTNRAAYYRGEVDRYGWVDVGSSYLPSDTLASFLSVQLDSLDRIQSHRVRSWHRYHDLLKPLEDAGKLKLPVVPDYATVNGHIFYLLTNTPEERTKLIAHLKKNGIQAVFHYVPLHSSPYYHERHDGRPLPNTDHFADCLLRLPFFYGLKKREISYIADKVKEFYD